MDLSEAFDCVPNFLLTKKLKKKEIESRMTCGKNTEAEREIFPLKHAKLLIALAPVLK